MKKTSEINKQAVGYLLGEMPDAERDGFEEQLFLDENLSFTLDEAESDLIDEYLRGELSAEQRSKFERNFLISESRREKLQAAKILQEKLFTEQKTEIAAPPISVWDRLSQIFRAPNFALAGGLAAIILFALIGVFWSLLSTKPDQIVTIGNNNQNISIEPINQPTIVNPPNTNASPKPELTPANVGEKPSNVNAKPKPSPTITPENIPQSQTAVFGFTLLPPMRSGERPTLDVPLETQTIRLRVEHNNAREYIKYRAEIRDSGGDLVWSREIPVTVKTLQKPLTLNVRSGALAAGSYELTLSGITSDAKLEEVNFYNFTVRKK